MIAKKVRGLRIATTARMAKAYSNGMVHRALWLAGSRHPYRSKQILPEPGERSHPFCCQPELANRVVDWGDRGRLAGGTDNPPPGNVLLKIVEFGQGVPNRQLCTRTTREKGNVRIAGHSPLGNPLHCTVDALGEITCHVAVHLLEFLRLRSSVPRGRSWLVGPCRQFICQQGGGRLGEWSDQASNSAWRGNIENRPGQPASRGWSRRVAYGIILVLSPANASAASSIAAVVVPPKKPSCIPVVITNDL